VINKLRALCAWYTKGLVGGGDLRMKINSTDSIAQLRDNIDSFFVPRPKASPKVLVPDDRRSTIDDELVSSFLASTACARRRHGRFLANHALWRPIAPGSERPITGRPVSTWFERPLATWPKRPIAFRPERSITRRTIAARS
jgi:hypothetical protein